MQKNNEDGNFLQARTLVITAIVLATAALRLAPHPMNFAPIGALALFGGAYFSSKREALAIPLLSLILGDVFTGFHQLIPFVYASFLVSVTIGFWLRGNRSAPRIAAATVAGAIQFFLVTNFALWASSIGSYAKTADGLAACYLAGIPLFWNTLASDAFYATLLFGGMALAERKFPMLREPLAANTN
jgi:uncharacterized protein DUF6580